MKRRILIALHYMELGGAEAALLGWLHNIDYERYDVDLFLYDARGELMSFIPKEVHLLPTIAQYTMLERPIVELVRKGYWLLAMMRIWAKIVTRWDLRNNSRHLDDATCFYNLSKYTTPLLPSINPTCRYDLAISFLTPHFIVSHKVHARKKIAWIHTDYSNIYVVPKKEVLMWETYDAIAAISDEAASKFITIFPTLKEKVYVQENILPERLITSRAQEFVPDDMKTEKDVYRILSIGRYCHPKRFDEVPCICKETLRMLPKNKSIRWYLIGYGGDEEIIRQKIKEAQMEEQVILLGKKSNPYPYISMCDIYVQPSRYEGKSVTVREAQLLHKPVVITNYPTAQSQINDGVDGKIVAMAISECAAGIADLLTDKDTQDKIRHYLMTHDYSYASEAEKTFRLLDL